VRKHKVDDFCQQYDLHFQVHTLSSKRKPTRTPGLAISEIMTIVLLFHKSPAKNFKYFYTSYLQLYRSEFPKLPKYNRFIELQQRCLGHFHALLAVLCAIVKHAGLGYVDSTPIPVCHIKRESCALLPCPASLEAAASLEAGKQLLPAKQGT